MNQRWVYEPVIKSEALSLQAAISQAELGHSEEQEKIAEEGHDLLGHWDVRDDRYDRLVLPSPSDLPDELGQ